MRNPQGYAVVSSGDGRVVETDTITCCHCNSVAFVHGLPGQAPDPGGFCRLCMKSVCGPCADAGVCTPFEKKLEAEERRSRLHDAVGTVRR